MLKQKLGPESAILVSVKKGGRLSFMGGTPGTEQPVSSSLGRFGPVKLSLINQMTQLLLFIKIHTAVPINSRLRCQPINKNHFIGVPFYYQTKKKYN